jgi:hypothetical protein
MFATDAWRERPEADSVMKISQFLKTTVVAAIAASLLVVGDASAQRGRGEGRGGGGGGGGQSFSRGDGGGSSRSFSRGGGGSSRSFSRGDSGASRSFSRGDSGQSRSFSRGDMESSRRTFTDQSRGRTYQAMRPSREGSPQFDRSFRSGQGERSTIGRSSDAIRSRELSDRASRQSQQYRGGRTSEDQVRDFLGIERGGERAVTGRSREGTRDRDFARDRDFDRDRDFTRERDLTRERERDIAGRDRDVTRDRDYQRWREGSRERDGDDRDWSGRWRDGDRFASARRIRESWRDRDWDDDDFPFSAKWWDNDRRWRGDHWNWWGRYAWRHNHPWHWWTWATVPRLTSWVAFGWPRPYYWDYGPGEYIYYDDGVVYVNGRWYAPGPVFYDRTVRIVESAPELTPDEAAELEWLPLGVFAVAEDRAADAFVMVQLAVTQDGVISGTAYDQRSGAAFPIEGMVEKQTQRAVWSYTDDRNRRVMMETSIFNLTQPEATGLVQFGPNDMRVVELVRLEQPEGSSATTGAAELPAP